MATAVPAILKYLSDSSNYNIVDQNIETPVRAKKRRLDHLSWEEKLQRKKLKNRVAAQTSRDRKKAKMDQMEKAVQELFTKNESLLDECEKLKKINERLSLENVELRNKLSMSACVHCQSRTVECETQSGSAARNGHTLSSVSEHGPVEDCAGLPSLPDLLDELNNDVDITSLEQLTQSLLQDIARDLEAAAEKADIQEPVADQEKSPGQVVGSTSEQLEPVGSESLKKEEDPLIEDISQYLLLHHNYSAKPKNKRTSTKSHCKKPKQILPKESKVDKLASDERTEVLYGTYDESTNCITIIVDDDASLSTNEVIIEDCLVDDSNTLTVPKTPVGSASPHSTTSSSDYGYESFGSPGEPEDSIWDNSVSELFPSLM